MGSRYECKCGCQGWLIWGNVIECTHCHTKYNLVHVGIISAFEFNRRRDVLEETQEVDDAVDLTPCPAH